MNEPSLKYVDFWEKLQDYIARSNMGAFFDDPRETMEETEYAYEKARSLLDPETEDDLVMHVAACEHFCRAYALAAYEMGREEGPRKPNETWRDWVKDPDEWEKILAAYHEFQRFHREQ